VSPEEILDDPAFDKYYFVYPHYKQALMMPEKNGFGLKRIESYLKQMVSFLDFCNFLTKN